MEISELQFVIYFGLFILLLLSIFVALFFISSYKRKIRHKQQLLQIDYEKQEAILKAQLEIQEQTLKTISLEIHDNIGQVLSLAKLNLATMNIYSPELLLEKIEDSKNLVAKAIQDLRDLSKSLNTDYVAEMGLVHSIEYELEMLKKTGSVDTVFLIKGRQIRLHQQKELVLFRIIQEALNNILRHSAANQIVINLQYLEKELCLEVVDNGIGFNLAALQEPGNPITGLGIQICIIGPGCWGAAF